MTDMEWNDGIQVIVWRRFDSSAWKDSPQLVRAAARGVNPYGRHHPRVEVAAEDSMGNAGQPPSSWKSLSLQQSQRTQTAINNANTNGSSNSNNNNMPPVPRRKPQDMLGRHEQNILNKIILQTETRPSSADLINSWRQLQQAWEKGAGLLDSKNWWDADSGRGCEYGRSTRVVAVLQ
jgi:hypothetical protein